MRKNVLTIVLCMLTLLLTSCSLFGGNNTQSTQQVKTPPDKQIYSAPLAGISDISTFDPALANDPSSIAVIQMVFTGLVQLDDKATAQPQMANTAILSPEG